jgi:superfamily II DNA or RNA helicase
MGEFSFPESELKRALPFLPNVRTLLFSGGTYQVEVTPLSSDEKESLWPFLQLTDQGEISDHFCTCTVAEEGGSCLHQAAAWQKIMGPKGVPLHVRFRHSLWNAIGLMASHRHGYDEKVLKGSLEKGWTILSPTKKKLFSLKGVSKKGKEALRQILLRRKAESEETSLKFSNLSAEEMQLWREGRPGPELQYELSFWSDLAKWWMVLQEAGEPIAIEFAPNIRELPREMVVTFPDVEFSIYIAEASWPQLIPSFSTVSSPLQVFELSHEQIRRIVYDPLKKALLLDMGKEGIQGEAPPSPNTIEIGEWAFVPEKGFYPSRMDPLLKERIIPQAKIGLFLQRHAFLVKRHLMGCKLHLDPMSAQYELVVTKEGSLQMALYLFERGDVQKWNSVDFGSWVYLADKGFYAIKDRLFEGARQEIPKEAVGAFVGTHRHWLNRYEGFEAHLTAVESHLTYRVTEEGDLLFIARLELPEEGEETIDYGDWIFIRGRGFYPKVARRATTIGPGSRILATEVAGFIQAHKEELEAIAQFFWEGSPIAASGLDLAVNGDGDVVITPHYRLLPEYEGHGVLFFGSFAFVPGKGFSEIPSDKRLPDAYRSAVVIDAARKPYFFAYELDALEPNITTIETSLKKTTNLQLHISDLTRDEEGRWIVDLVYTSEFGSVEPFVIWEAIHAGEKWLPSPAGLLTLKSAQLSWLKSITKKHWISKEKKLRLSALEWIRLFAYDNPAPPEAGKGLELFAAFKSFEASRPLVCEGLMSELRPYQEVGVKWLWFLYCYGLSGLLCDEMGLGKTHQAMALLSAAKGKFLVVCPTSVIYHWEELLRRFLPRLRVLVFYGAARSLEQFESSYDLLLTSYGTARSEKKALSELSFEVAIFDEIQMAKNAHSQTHQALRQISAWMRLGLTGTPIENRLLELKALFDVVLPNYFPPDTLFKDLFVHPIEKQSDEERRQLLQKLIHPFLLRRKKAEVLLELPEKTEQIAYAALSDEQKSLYKETYLTHRDLLWKELNDPSRPVPYLHIFSVLSKLKQICDHPALARGDPLAYERHSCGKWDLFVQLFEEVRASGQKLVVFSQYLGMLDILEDFLGKQNVGFAAIRGSTRDRREQMHRFQNDPSCEVFLGSLQAAGVGIDLTAASVVIHYDRWWNPAKENQATDRVHRIGQRRGVQVFKMVTKGTVEEQIHRIIERKEALLEQIVGYDDQNELKTLSREELEALVRSMELNS